MLSIVRGTDWAARVNDCEREADVTIETVGRVPRAVRAKLRDAHGISGHPHVGTSVPDVVLTTMVHCVM